MVGGLGGRRNFVIGKEEFDDQELPEVDSNGCPKFKGNYGFGKGFFSRTFRVHGVHVS